MRSNRTMKYSIIQIYTANLSRLAFLPSVFRSPSIAYVSLAYMYLEA